METFDRISLGVVSKFLTEQQMKGVKAGYGYGEKKPWPGQKTGTCGWRSGGDIICCASQEEVFRLYDEWSGNWCCDSCGTTTYCGDWTC